MIPSGTVTFLFSDIESSTLLWQDHPDAMPGALARHDQLIREAVEAHQGQVFKTMGDAFCVVFSTAPDAVAGALAAQAALLGEPWPIGCELRVRMAVHTGAPEIRDNDYFGPVLNRVARLLAAGHGGQILLSLATTELCRDKLPAGVTLEDLGEHRLKDLTRREQVFQLRHASLPVVTAPLRTLDAFPNNLPQQATTFVGRQKELADLSEVLARTRLVMLTGAGGSGKTRLSLQLAADSLEAFPDGIWCVNLAPLSGSGDVAQAIALTMGIRESAAVEHLESIGLAVGSRRMLVVLDNCEHLLAECARVVDALLQACPNLKVVATSREALNLSGEQIYRVPSLSVPDPKKQTDAVGVAQFEAVRLFIDRVHLAKLDFAVTDENAGALASICARLDGIPLAIELAAARIRSLSLEEINSRLAVSFKILTGGSRTALPRQQTLRAMIDWSHDLLSDPERVLFRRVAIFSSGWSLEACESVCSGDGLDADDILDLLAALTDKSLVSAEETAGQTRYRLLETMREYALEKLEASGETEVLRKRHLDYFAALIESVRLTSAAENESKAMARLELDYDNIRAALASALVSSEGPGQALAMGGGFNRYWFVRGLFSEANEFLEAALALPWGPAQAGQRLFALNVICLNYGWVEMWDQGLRYLPELIELAKERGDNAQLALALNTMGMISTDHHKDFPAALQYYGEALEINLKQPLKGRAHANLVNISEVLGFEGRYEEAMAALDEAERISTARSERSMLASIYDHRSRIYHYQCQWAEARAEALRATEIFSAERMPLWQIISLEAMGRLHWEVGELDSALEMIESAEAVLRTHPERWLAMTRITHGAILAGLGSFSDAREALVEGLTSSESDQMMVVPWGLLATAYFEVKRGRVESGAAVLGAAKAVRSLRPVVVHPNELAIFKSIEESSGSAVFSGSEPEAVELALKALAD